jgi:arginyl-tRNA synthetase
VHQRLLVNQYTAIKQLIYNQLVLALNIYTSNGVILCMADRKIPLHKVRDGGRILYISGAALQLSKSQNSTAMEIAVDITAHLLATCSHVFSVQIVPPGWIHLELTHSTLAAWLQSLTASSARGNQIIHKPQITNHNFSSLFAIQYAHARCCSLIQLAHREGLIKLSQANTGLDVWSVVSLQPIPWLNCEQKLRLNHPDEMCLIGELVQVVDDWEIMDFGSSVNWKKIAMNLSQAFENFWCKCRIWGEVKITSPELAQARVGLLMATQFVLRALLEEKLGVVALREL